jgi:hypothetical protein
MPVRWTIDHSARLVVATAQGVLCLEDIENYLDGVAAAATLSYRKLFDMTHCWPALREEDMPALGARIRDHEARGRVGEVVIVAVSDKAYQQAQLFETLVVANRPLKIVRDIRAAYAWLSRGPEERDHRRGDKAVYSPKPERKSMAGLPRVAD